jgi:precorrin-6A/cobalt-precorrin-6A reductase
MMRVLLLGGTTDANQMSRSLADAGISSVFSYAGRTAAPTVQPIPTRRGGFGGVAGLVDYLQHEQITNVIDATHPFAAQMSGNAVNACKQTNIPLVALERPPWERGPGDAWRMVADIAAAVAALPDAPARVFLAIGKQTLSAFAAKPQHFYLLRMIDPPQIPLPLADADVIVGRGPFTTDGDRALMQSHKITHVVAKNAGGTSARAKLDAARGLGLPVIMIDRPQAPGRHTVQSVEDVLRWLGHSDRRGV